jgi:hypothetical protein
MSVAYTLQLRQLPDNQMRIPLIVGLIIRDEGMKEQMDYMYVLCLNVTSSAVLYLPGIPNKPRPRGIKPSQYQLTINDSITRNLNFQDDDQAAFFFEAKRIIALPLTLSLETPGSIFSCTLQGPKQDQNVTFIGNRDTV